MATLNPHAQIFVPIPSKTLVDLPQSNIICVLTPYYHYYLPLPQSFSMFYPPLPLPNSYPTSNFPSCASIAVFSTTKATCAPTVVNYYQSPLSPDWYQCINQSPSASQPFYYDHQTDGLTFVAADEVEKNVNHENKLKGSKVKRKKMRNKPPRLCGSHDHHPSANPKKVWKPKSAVSNDDHDRAMDLLLPSKNLLVDKQNDSTHLSCKDTTLMIRHIPMKYTKEMLITLLDEHCKGENEKETVTGDDHEKEKDDKRLSAFDFLYLPIDFKTCYNRGYAFVNMTNSTAARKLEQFLSNYKWRVYQSKKICKISPAKIQGKDALLKHFNDIYFPCDTDKFLPVSFSPCRDGLGGSVVESTVGRFAS